MEALQEAAEDPTTHQYPSYYGMPELRRAIAAWYARRFGVEVDPDTEVLPLIGSKEGLAHLSIAFVDPDDEVLVPTMTFAATANAVEQVGATPIFVDSEPGTGLIDLDAADRLVTSRTKGMIPVHLAGRPARVEHRHAATLEHREDLVDPVRVPVVVAEHGHDSGARGAGDVG